MNSSKRLSITEDMIKHMHKRLTGTDLYRTEALKNPDAENHGAAPEDIQHLMGHLTDQILSSQSTLSPEELAAMAYKRFMDIQPFADANRQTADALKRFILEHYGCDGEIDAENLFSDSIIF